MWIIRALTMQTQLAELDRQMDKLRKLVDRNSQATGGRS
ncbi:protein of unknown function [Trichlorobacter ammonificans]|uniref:Uncharacterized protein n=1 Tax=Trichlorobacter ammonificans TaxID=2916410 RepID=A0ABN8HMN0_9BACT|nr:protein of unknown function [Trichlorobacter ammonificans]